MCSEVKELLTYISCFGCIYFKVCACSLILFMIFEIGMKFTKKDYLSFFTFCSFLSSSLLRAKNFLVDL